MKRFKENYDYSQIEGEELIPLNFSGKKKSLHLPGCTCPDCKESKGEELIAEWVDSHNLPYEREYRIKNCKDKRPLPFDFAIFYDNEKQHLRILIEFDGIQHFQEIYKGKLAETKRHDDIKTNYCNREGIPLLRIHYKNTDRIEEILDKVIT
jgi:very-short-patch-repair endonuclease